MLYYITSNQEKVNVAQKNLNPLGIEIEKKSFDFVEIQSESIEEIAVHKAKSAFEKLQHPLIVNDAAWHLPALNGFPGPYMKYVNQWFTAENFQTLLEGKEDRTVIYEEVFCYISSTTVNTFKGQVSGIVLNEPKGQGLLSWRFFSFSQDKSIAECWEDGIDPIENYTVWKEIADFFNTVPNSI